MGGDLTPQDSYAGGESGIWLSFQTRSATGSLVNSSVGKSFCSNGQIKEDETNLMFLDDFLKFIFEF